MPQEMFDLALLAQTLWYELEASSTVGGHNALYYMDDTDPLTIRVMSRDNSTRLALLRQRIQPGIPGMWPDTKVTEIQDETGWATPVLGALVWLIEDLRIQDEEDEDLIYDG